jgi:hypothetical protein
MKHEQWRFDLLKAAQLIREYGLQQCHLEGPNGYCILGAILGALSTFDDDYKAVVSRVAAHLRADHQWRLCASGYENNYFYISQWNDQPERTAQEVIDLLERTAGDAA